MYLNRHPTRLRDSGTGQPHRFSSRLTRAFSINEFFFLATVSQHRKSHKKKNSRGRYLNRHPTRCSVPANRTFRAIWWGTNLPNLVKYVNAKNERNDSMQELGRQTLFQNCFKKVCRYGRIALSYVNGDSAYRCLAFVLDWSARHRSSRQHIQVDGTSLLGPATP